MRRPHIEANSSWPSRSSSSASEAVVTPTTTTTTTTTTSASASSSFSSSRFSPFHSFQHATTAAAYESAGGAVPPLLGLQRLAGNAFSLRQVPAPRASSPAVTNGAARTTDQQARKSSPRIPAPRSAGKGGATKPMATKTSTAHAFITPDTSPRAGWPTQTPPPHSTRNSARRVSDRNAQLASRAQKKQQQQQQQQQQSAYSSPSNGATQSHSLPVSARRQVQQCVYSARVPASHSLPVDPRERSGQMSEAPSHSPASVHFAATYNAESSFSPPFQPMSAHPHSDLHHACSNGTPQGGAWHGGDRHAQSYHYQPRVPTTSAALHSCPDTSASTPLQLPARQPAWRSVGQPPLSGQRDGFPQSSQPLGVESCVAPSLCQGNASPLRLPLSTTALFLSPAETHHASVILPQPYTSSSLTPPSVDALRHLFQQYLDAQRALEPMLRQLHVHPSRFLPLALQESVLEQVGEFAAQLESQLHAAASISRDNSLALCDGAPTLCLGDGARCDHAIPVAASEQARCPTPRPRDVRRTSGAIDWGVVLPFLPLPPASAFATLRAVGPAARRRVEQHAWAWLVEEVRTCVCPFVVENGAEEHVRDAYARLDGRERQYVGSVPVARRTPAPVPRHCRSVADDEEERVMNGSVLLDCERQSLLLNRAWREGWLHRGMLSPLHYARPVFSHARALRSLRLNPSRIHVDGVVYDVLRPRRNQYVGAATGNAAGDATGATAAAAAGGGGGGGGGVDDFAANTVHRAGLTPPPPPMLDARPTAALSVTRKLLGDAVSAISRERARSADATTQARLARKTTPPSVAVAEPAPASAAHLTKAGEDNESIGCTSTGGGTNEKTTPSEQRFHPYFRHDALPVVLEDVNGTAHVFCTRNTAMDSDAVRSMLRGWLQHHHRLRRQPLYTTAAKFLLGMPSTEGEEADEDGHEWAGFDDDYVVGAAAASAEVKLEGDREGEASAPPSVSEQAAADGTTSDDAGMMLLQTEEDLGVVTRQAADPTRRRCSTRSPQRVARERLFRARLQDWRNKREVVVHRMNCVDPPWLMLGNAGGPQPRPLSLHLTEQQIPWLATQLCPDSDSGGLADLQELHLCIAESLLPPGWMPAWQWCWSVLRSRKNLLVVSVATAEKPPPLSRGMSRHYDSDAAASAASDLANMRDTVTSLLCPSFIDAVLHTASAQVVDLHGSTAEAAAALLNGSIVAGSEERGFECAQEPHTGAGTPLARLSRLRDLYVTVRRGHGAGASPRAAPLSEVCLSADVFPALQVLWLDAPRLRHFRFDRLLVLRELHLICDATLVCSALRGVERLPYLEVLHVERAIIDDCAFVGECQALRELLLHGCRLSFALLAASADGDGAASAAAAVEELRGVERAPRLETLSLCYTEEIRHIGNFARCRSLRRVLLTRCNGISSTSIAGFERLPRLELLALEYTRVSGLSQLAKSPTLRVLRVDGCKRVLRSSVMGLEMAPRLTELSLQDTNVSTVANFGGGCTALRALDLSGCRHLDVDGLQGIQALPQLEVLSLSHTPITDVNFLTDCLRLTTLYVEGCTALVPAALEDLVSAPVLRTIIANGCTRLARVGQLGRARALEVLSVAGAEALTTAGVQGIERNARLRYLDLAATAVDSVQFLARGCRGLRFLSVKGCTRLVSVRELHGVEELPQLQTLNMENLSVSGSLDFLTLSSSLQYVSFSGCSALQEDDVQALRRSDVCTSIP